MPISPEPYLGYRVYGPYKRNDNRSHVVLYKDNLHKTTISYPRYLVEVSLGRKLKDSEDVHHKNGNVDDNKLDNFEVIDSLIHKKLTQQKYYDKKIICYECKKEFIWSAKSQSYFVGNNSNQGPFCSRECSGKWSTTGENQRLGHTKQIMQNWKPII